jgi:hypothetical protein
MRALVFAAVGAVAKGGVAVAAEIRLVAGVHTLVALEITGAAEHFWTVSALITPGPARRCCGPRFRRGGGGLAVAADARGR